MSRLIAPASVVAEAASDEPPPPSCLGTRSLTAAVLQTALEQGNDTWIAALHAAHAAMHGVNRNTWTDPWAPPHAEFHRGRRAPCDSVWLIRCRDLLFEQSERCRYPLGQLETDNRPPAERDVDAEHLALLDAACERDADRVITVLGQHFVGTMDGVLGATAIQ